MATTDAHRLAGDGELPVVPNQIRICDLERSTTGKRVMQSNVGHGRTCKSPLVGRRACRPSLFQMVAKQLQGIGAE